MAEATGLRNAALPYPVYGVPYAIAFPYLDADGDLVTGATTPDTEISKNGDTFADCTNEATEIATSSGMYYLLLTATEMTTDVAAIISKSATAGMKTTSLVLYPRKLVSLRTGTAAAGAAGTLTLDSGAAAIDDYWNGCLLVTTGGTGSGQARVISDYVGSTKVASVTPNWATTPDNTTTFAIYLPEGRQVQQSDPVAWNGTAVATPDTAGYPKVTIKSGTGTGELNLSSGVIDANVTKNAGTAITSASGIQEVKVASIAASAITATSIASDAITDAKVASDVTIASVTGAVGSVTGNVGGNVTGSVGSIATGGIASASFASGAINAAAIAPDAIGASELAADAVTEIQSGLSTLTAAGVRSAVGLATANLDTQLAAIQTKTDNLPSDPADASVIAASFSSAAGEFVTLNTKLDAIDDFIDTEVAAIKTQTDKMVFTVANQLDVNVIDWKSSAAPAMTGDAYARLGAPAGASVSADIAAVQADTDNIQTRLPAALVSGRIDASVGAMAANVMTAAAAAADLATELQSGLATSSALSTLQTSVDDLPTNAELAAALGTADDAVLAQVALVKAKTDSLTFSQAGVVDAHVKYVAGEQVVGAGTEADPWGPA